MCASSVGSRDLSVFDQIIITPNGRPLAKPCFLSIAARRPVPNVCGDLDDPSEEYGLGAPEFRCGVPFSCT